MGSEFSISLQRTKSATVWTEIFLWKNQFLWTFDVLKSCGLIFWTLFSRCYCNKMPSTADGIWLIFYRHFIHEISLLVFKKILWCNLCLWHLTQSSSHSIHVRLCTSLALCDAIKQNESEVEKNENFITWHLLFAYYLSFNFVKTPWSALVH